MVGIHADNLASVHTADCLMRFWTAHVSDCKTQNPIFDLPCAGVSKSSFGRVESLRKAAIGRHDYLMVAMCPTAADRMGKLGVTATARR